MGAKDDEIQQYDGLEPSSKFLLNGQLSGRMCDEALLLQA